MTKKDGKSTTQIEDMDKLRGEGAMILASDGTANAFYSIADGSLKNKISTFNLHCMQSNGPLMKYPLDIVYVAPNIKNNFDEG